MKISLYLFAVLFSLNIIGQEKINPKLYQKDLRIANQLFEMEDYYNAIAQYRKVLAINPGHEISNLNSAISRIKLGQPTDSSFQNLIKLKSSKLPEVQFYFGIIYHLTGNFEEAINCYTKYKAMLPKYRTIQDAEVEYHISCSKNAQEFIGKPHLALIKNLGNVINSKYPDYVPLITPDESVLYFTSRRDGGVGNLKDVYNNYYEDVYMSLKGDDGKWTTPKNIGAPINTNTHDACVALSFDGNEMMIYRTASDMITGDLYTCKTSTTGWAEPKKLGPEINTPHIETSACFSNDTSVIFFSSNKPGGFGGKDLYRIKKLPNGHWSTPMNLGPKVNTDKDEDAPYFHPDGVTLYFSSRGHNTMGDYDIFKTTWDNENNQFTKVENLGYPINTVNNDNFFVLNASGTRGYYSSFREDSYGGSDIYVIDTRYGDNDLKVKQGKVVFGSEPQKAKITLIDIESKQVSGIFNASAKTGKFLLVVNPLKYYKAIIEEDGFQTMILDLEPLANESSESEMILSLTKKR